MLKPLYAYLSLWQNPYRQGNTLVTTLTHDSTQITEGALFFALPGLKKDGHDFLETACQKALFCIGEKPYTASNYLQVKDAKKAYSQASSFYFDHPSHHLTLIAITGTSGKTTTTYLLEDLCIQAKRPVGVIGTINIRFQDQIYRATHTTPDAFTFQKVLHTMLQNKVQIVICEVSSHALKQKRVDDVAFDIMAFTNLSPEHLDYHEDMEDYFQSKALLFTHLVKHAKSIGKSPVAIIHDQTDWGQKLCALTEKYVRLHTPSYPFSSDATGIHGNFEGQAITSPLIGTFNIENLLMALTIAKSLKIPIASHFPLHPIPGRLEKIAPDIFVDYAHKPDALQKVLITLQESYPDYAIILVFGCGGDRDRLKRPLMGKIAARLAHQVILTSDNPRSEDPLAIIQEIFEPIQNESHILIIPDRKKAIEKAIVLKKPKDLVLVAGKGHETYQTIQGIDTFFDDAVIIRETIFVKNIL